MKITEHGRDTAYTTNHAHHSAHAYYTLTSYAHKTNL